jgi:hypothetical protein
MTTLVRLLEQTIYIVWQRASSRLTTFRNWIKTGQTPSVWIFAEDRKLRKPHYTLQDTCFHVQK